MFFNIFSLSRFYGWKNFVSGILDNPIYFIFTMITNISFYGTIQADGSSGIEMENVKIEKKWTTPQMKEKEELELASCSVDQNRKEVFDNESSQDEENDSGQHDLKEQVEIKNENALGDEKEMISAVANQSENTIEAPTTSMDNGTEDFVDGGEESIKPPDKMKMMFSYHQSNVLYILFLLGFGTSLALDIVFQMHR